MADLERRKFASGEGRRWTGGGRARVVKKRSRHCRRLKV